MAKQPVHPHPINFPLYPISISRGIVIFSLFLFPLLSPGQTLGPEMTLRNGALNGSTFEEVMAFDGTAGFVAWTDTRIGGFGGDDVYAQKVNADGSVAWTMDGYPACDADQSQNNPQLSPDGSGGLFVVWSDERPSGWTAIYGQRISPDGTPLWTEDGIQLGGSDNDQYQPRVLHIDGEEFYVTHGEERDGSSGREYWLIVHRIGANGQQLWEPTGFPALKGVRAMSSALDGEGGLVVFGRIREDAEGYRVQRVLSNQMLAWENPVDILGDLPDYSSSRAYFTYDGDGVGGILIAYFTASTLRLVRVAGDGSTPWGPTGILISENISTLQLPDVLADGNGGAFISWIEDDLPDRLRMQHYQSDGSPAWASGGIEMAGDSAAFFSNPNISPDGEGGFFISFETSFNTWAQQVNSAGQALWDDAGSSGLNLESGFEPEIGPGGKGPLVIMEKSDGLVSRAITGLPFTGLTVGDWSETEIGWVYGVTADWGLSAYMGTVYLPLLPFIYQVNLGWLYAFASNRPEHVLFAYDHGWLLTNESWGGFYYNYATAAYAEFGDPPP